MQKVLKSLLPLLIEILSFFLFIYNFLLFQSVLFSPLPFLYHGFLCICMKRNSFTHPCIYNFIPTIQFKANKRYILSSFQLNAFIQGKLFYILENADVEDIEIRRLLISSQYQKNLQKDECSVSVKCNLLPFWQI